MPITIGFLVFMVVCISLQQVRFPSLPIPVVVWGFKVAYLLFLGLLYASPLIAVFVLY